MQNSPLVKRASDEVFKQLLAMPEAEFKALFKQDSTERCSTETCGGACQGLGWCYSAQDFRGEAPDKHMEDLMG